MRHILILLTLFVAFNAFALESEEGETDPTLTEREVRDKQVREALISSRKEQNFSLYKLNYGILNDDDLLLQYSFKYRIIEEFYLAYTNLILWDIYEDGMPAEDNNFMPEAFYRFLIDKKWGSSIDAGWFHRSNGRQGPDSRAWDRWQVRLNSEHQWRNLNILWSVTAYTDIDKSSNNQDINDYSGPWDTNLVFRNLLGDQKRELDLSFKLVSGKEGYTFNTGQKVVGLHYRMPYAAFRPTIFAQYFYGYGELIKHYNVKSESFRAGLSFHY
ncbi:phospholipase A [Teredinibacter franksiae]|uniref:phospholipase A n=1 Tax=Teredinibacter franksiae TaxID=2761453 RepID=UPI001628AFB8|nr:phospholipase A [Teredinibacter franksiae]